MPHVHVPRRAVEHRLRIARQLERSCRPLPRRGHGEDVPERHTQRTARAEDAAHRVERVAAPRDRRVEAQHEHQRVRRRRALSVWPEHEAAEERDGLLDLPARRVRDLRADCTDRDLRADCADRAAAAASPVLHQWRMRRRRRQRRCALLRGADVARGLAANVAVYGVPAHGSDAARAHVTHRPPPLLDGHRLLAPQANSRAPRAFLAAPRVKVALGLGILAGDAGSRRRRHARFLGPPRSATTHQASSLPH
mmetsp:Transcript_34518/g.110266  ORF Transcript_34518/g.110266 Transcript_34518/m.110266 type:complete len:252 (+) Transcript_34518:1656-2411(+)